MKLIREVLNRTLEAFAVQHSKISKEGLKEYHKSKALKKKIKKMSFGQ